VTDNAAAGRDTRIDIARDQRPFETRHGATLVE
jgi:hypothetical protein